MRSEQNKLYLHAAVTRYVSGPESVELEKFLTRIMGHESSGSLTAKNEHSSATGLFQFTQDTWRQYGHGGNIFDPAAQCDAVVRFALDNGRQLEHLLGRNPTAGEYYLAHFAGIGGALKILQASNSTSISDLLSKKAIASNTDIQLEKGYGKYFKHFTVGDIKHWANRVMGTPNTAFDGLDKNEGDNVANDSLISTLLQVFASLLEGIFGSVKQAPGDVADQNNVHLPAHLSAKKHSPAAKSHRHN